MLAIEALAANAPRLARREARTYIAAAMILGVHFALNSGTVDSIVYDVVLEETGSSDQYETWIGRVRMVESGAFVASALIRGVEHLSKHAIDRLSAMLTVLETLGPAERAVFGEGNEPERAELEYGLGEHPDERRE
jgi:hypothetical protein